jgi:endogenous inhibitor of DNA gyrase (YacG/DUF329 family)
MEELFGDIRIDVRWRFTPDIRIISLNAGRMVVEAVATCAQCRISFEQPDKGRARKFCDLKCEKTYHNKRRDGPPAAECKACKKALPTNCGKQKVCNDKCRMKLYRLLRRKIPLSRPCAHCGKKVVYTGRGRTDIKYCSRKCKSAAYWKKGKKDERQDAVSNPLPRRNEVHGTHALQ